VRREQTKTRSPGPKEGFWNTRKTSRENAHFRQILKCRGSYHMRAIHKNSAKLFSLGGQIASPAPPPFVVHEQLVFVLHHYQRTTNCVRVRGPLCVLVYLCVCLMWGLQWHFPCTFCLLRNTLFLAALSSCTIFLWQWHLL